MFTKRCTLFAAAMLGFWAVGVCGQAAETPPPAPAAAEKPTEEITASIFYRDVEPKLLFQMLSETYHVQFEGVEALTEPVSLISEGKDEVGIDGMLQLLNAKLVTENKAALREGSVIRIVPLEDTHPKTINLTYADPEKVVNTLKALYLVKGDEKGEDKGRKATYIGVHPQLKGVLVVGPKDALTNIETFVKTELDVATPPQPPQAPLQQKYVVLEYLAADEFKQLLEKDIDPAQAFSAAVAPNNTLIISSREPAVFARADELKKTFDIDRMEIRYIPLRNANANNIAELLKGIYPAQLVENPTELNQLRRQRRASGEGETFVPGLPAELLRQAGLGDVPMEQLLSESLAIVGGEELTIVPDTERNGLLIRTFSRNFAPLLELIEKIDQHRDQVMIDVFITGVELDDSMELGVDFSYNAAARRWEGGYTLGQDVGAAGDMTGLSYQFISENIEVLLRALQETGRLEILTRPSVMTKDNTKATISVGRDVPTVASTNVSTEGAVNSVIKYTDVYTKLEVTPQIHPDGYITLAINQTIDDVSTETFQISEQFNPQVLIRRRAETILRVRDGQTVCLGGFIGDNTREEETGIPFLKDIPLLGNLFMYKYTEVNKRELIIFITPHILRTPEEMLRMTNEQRRISSYKISEEKQERRGVEDTLLPQRELRMPPYRDGDSTPPTQDRGEEENI